MTAALSLMLPGSRVLLGWWRELEPFRPQQLWFAHLLLHRVEALVAVADSRPLDRMRAALLRALTLPPSPADPLEALHLDRQVRARLLEELAAAGLIQPAGAGRWEPTAAGRHAFSNGAVETLVPRRRTFYFVDQSPRKGPPHFLALNRPAAPLGAPEGWGFDPALLEECVRRPAEWKRRHHFPPEVKAVYAPSAEAADWRRVIVDQPEQLFLAVVRVPAEPGLLGFAVRPEGWALEGGAPVVELGEGAGEVFPGLAEGPGEEGWRQAWLAWCQPRVIPAAEAEACRLEPSGHRLLVHAPARLVERLRAARSDATRNEAWLLAGAGPLRAAAQMELVQGDR